MDANIVPLDLDKIFVQKIEAPWLAEKNVSLDVLRLDVLHPVVSGNKWFKLQYHLQAALQQGNTAIATFGGAFSNHIIATAFACKEAGLKSVGFIRGEETPTSHTLEYAIELGMQLHYVSREDYRDKESIKNKYNHESFYWINEGGYGENGAMGAASILNHVHQEKYDCIITSVGTGTMLAGLMGASEIPVMGISSMKGNTELEEAVKKLLPGRKLSTPVTILHDYHFGGYAKHPPHLLQFINEVYLQYKLPLDIVYTAKTFFAIYDLTCKNHFTPGTRLLMVHSGGLQGNQSLAAGQLSFL